MQVECIEGRFDTMGVQGQDFKPELLGESGKPVKESKGLKKANLSPRTKAILEEVALSEQVRSADGYALHGLHKICWTGMLACVCRTWGRMCVRKTRGRESCKKMRLDVAVYE